MKDRIHFQLQNSYSNWIWFINFGKLVLVSILHLIIDKKSIKDYHHFESAEFKPQEICISVWQWKIRIHLQNYSYSNCIWFINFEKILDTLHLIIDKKSIKDFDFHRFEYIPVWQWRIEFVLVGKLLLSILVPNRFVTDKKLILEFSFPSIRNSRINPQKNLYFRSDNEQSNSFTLRNYSYRHSFQIIL